MSHRLDLQYGLRPHFKYVATTKNPANLITRGLTLKKFMSSLEFLYHGPPLLHDGIHHWVTQNLLCLDRQSCWIAQTSAGPGGRLSFHHPLGTVFYIYSFVKAHILGIQVHQWTAETRGGLWQESSSLSNENSATTGICKRDSSWIPFGSYCLTWFVLSIFSWTGRGWFTLVGESIDLRILDMTLRTPFYWGGKTTYYQTYCNGRLF